MAVHTCNPSPGEVEAGGSQITGHSHLHKKLKSNLSYMRPCLKHTHTHIPLQGFDHCCYLIFVILLLPLKSPLPSLNSLGACKTLFSTSICKVFQHIFNQIHVAGPYPTRFIPKHHQAACFILAYQSLVLLHCCLMRTTAIQLY